MGDIKSYVTVKGAAKSLGLSKSRIEQYVRDGRLRVAYVLDDGTRLLLRSEVAKLKVRPGPGAPKRKDGGKPK